MSSPRTFRKDLLGFYGRSNAFVTKLVCKVRGDPNP